MASDDTIIEWNSLCGEEDPVFWVSALWKHEYASSFILIYIFTMNLNEMYSFYFIGILAKNRFIMLGVSAKISGNKNAFQ